MAHNIQWPNSNYLCLAQAPLNALKLDFTILLTAAKLLKGLRFHGQCRCSLTSDVVMLAIKLKLAADLT